MTDDYRVKHKAKVKAKRRIDDGRIQKLPCFACGSSETLAHHEDYFKPLDVVWYCRVHHALRHREINDLWMTATAEDRMWELQRVKVKSKRRD